MTTQREALKMALEALKIGYDYAAEETERFHVEMAGYKPKRHEAMDADVRQIDDAITAIHEALAQQQEPVGIKEVAKKAGINMPETYIPTMDDAIAAGDSVIMNEQAALLRECRAALDSLIAQKPTLAGLLCGSTTLGNLKAELGAYRPQGVFGTSPPAKPWVGLTDEEIESIFSSCSVWDKFKYERMLEVKLKEKNT